VAKHLYLLLTLLTTVLTCHAEESTELNNDPHYNKVGFFDIHLCNWPERPDFFKVLFSSKDFNQIKSMKVYTPDDHLLVTLDQTKFKVLKRNNKQEKRVYMLDIDAPKTGVSGWYTINVETNDGTVHYAKDYVIMTRLEKISKMQPSDDIVLELPVTLNWEPVPGSQFYQVFIKDEWTGSSVYSSALLNKPEIVIPDGKLKPGGYYSWSVHARDTNEHVLLGDFHMGSLSKKAFFNVAE